MFLRRETLTSCGLVKRFTSKPHDGHSLFLREPSTAGAQDRDNEDRGV